MNFRLQTALQKFFRFCLKFVVENVVSQNKGKIGNNTELPFLLFFVVFVVESVYIL